MTSWHVFATLERWHVDLAGTHGTYGTRFRKLLYGLRKCKCDHENYDTNNFYDMTTLRYLAIKENFE